VDGLLFNFLPKLSIAYPVAQAITSATAAAGAGPPFRSRVPEPRGVPRPPPLLLPSLRSILFKTTISGPVMAAVNQMRAKFQVSIFLVQALLMCERVR
jgi:hypothetical protein